MTANQTPPTTTQASGDRHPLLTEHPSYWRETAEKFRAEGYDGLAESYELLAQQAERVCACLADEAAGRAR